MTEWNKDYWYDFGQERVPHLVGKRKHFIKEDAAEISMILHAVKENHTEDFSHYLEGSDSWWIFYHLSGMRNALFGWYDFEPDAEILEIGGDFGALTGLFCDRCRHVTVTEERMYRAQAICERYSQRENLKVYAGRFCDMQACFVGKFDYVVIVGGLEKQGYGWSDQAPYVQFLRLVIDCLKPGGKILLAADNRYGLRNFCGARNWQTGKPFDGINRFPNGTEKYEFRKPELEEIIKKAGILEYKFYYPLPDYRLAQLIYTDEYQNAQHVAERLEFYDMDQSTLLVAERNLYEDVIEQGALPFFSNSFFVEMGNSCRLSDTVYAVVSADRGEEYSFATVIGKDDIVHKRAVFPEGEKALYKAYNHICTLKQCGVSVVPHRMERGVMQMPRQKELTLSGILKKAVVTDQAEFIYWLDLLYAEILRSSEEADERDNVLQTDQTADVDFGCILKKAYIDMVPVNCFVIDGKLYFFDQEFVWENFPSRFVLFRALKYTYMSMWDMERYLPLGYLKEKYGFSERLWDIFEKEEEKFIASLRNQKMYAQFYQWKQIQEQEIRKRGAYLESPIDPVSYEIYKNTDAVRNVELCLLEKFQEVCEKYQIRYFGIYGTMIGAVRYEGYIPWQDRIEIAVPREDYTRLLALADTEFKEPYFVQTMKSDPQCFMGGYSRLQDIRTTAIEMRNWDKNCKKGIGIDIFPLDVCYEDERKNRFLWKKILFCQKVILVKLYEQSDYSYWIGEKEWQRLERIGRKFALEQLYGQLEGLFLSGAANGGERIGILSKISWLDPFVIYEKCWFEQPQIQKFEAFRLPVPNGYKNCLEQEGIKDTDLLQVEDRKPENIMCFYAADISYRVYEKRFVVQRPEPAQVNNSGIILLGHGEVLDDYLFYNNKSYPPEIVADTDPQYYGKSQYGYEIQPFDQIRPKLLQTKTIVICSIDFRKYEKILHNRNIGRYLIYLHEKVWALYSGE